MKKILMICLTTAAASACSMSPAPADDEIEVGETRDPLSVRARIGRLKRQIRAIASANTNRTDNFDEIAGEILPLVKQLEAIAPVRTQAETLGALEGAWHSLWSNLEIGSPGTKVDLSDVYQVVTQDGYYYNLSNSRTLGLFKTTGVLRGAYTSGPLGLAIEFTTTGYRLGHLQGDLFHLVRNIEAGSVPVLYLPARAPRGPVGIKGMLTTQFVDADLRIAGGTQEPFTSADGEVLVPGKTNLLFVLERQATPLP